jgi:hypothetical protein
MILSSLSRSALVGLTVLLVLAAPATAQTDPREQARLKGITEVEISIEGFTADDTRSPRNPNLRKCGISEGLLNAAMTKALFDNGIRIVERGSFTEAGLEALPPVLYVRTTSLYFEPSDLCVTNVEVELGDYLLATPAHSLTEVFGEFVLATRGSILSFG